MDFIDRIRTLAERVPTQMEHCQTEEATKNALIMPFINALGYDVFDPTEVVPEFTADVGTKKGEKVDYAIMKDGAPIMLIECKWSGADLNAVHASQLYRYFSVVPNARFGVLTNGVVYRFYTDLDALNIMDKTPFFEFNMLDVRERSVAELKKFTKSAFDLEHIITNASELKYTDAIRKLIVKEFEETSDGFVRYFASQVYQGRMTQTVRDQFTDITQKALKRFLNDWINERLQSAITSEPEIKRQPQEVADEIVEVVDELEKSSGKREIVTTEDEIEGYFAVKSILRETVDLGRIHMRDTKSYCGVLLDDNNRKPICRLHFNREQKYLGIFDDDRNESRVPIDSVDDIYSHADEIMNTVKFYDSA